MGCLMKHLSRDDFCSIASQIIEKTKPSVDASIQMGKEEYRKRWKMVQDAMEKEGYDLLYVCGSELDRTDAAWLAGIFDPMIERYGVIVPRRETPVVLAGSEGGHVIEEAVKRSGAEIALLREFQISDEDYRWAHFTGLEALLSKIGIKKNAKVAIASSSQFIPYDHVLKFQGKFGADNVVFDPMLLQLIKYEKSDKELAIIQQANIIADAAMRGMLAVTAAGVTELQVAGVGDYVMKELGAARTGFTTIVTSGDRGSTVIGAASNKVIEKGDVVSLGVSPTFNGYHGISRRTVVAGCDPTLEQKEFIKAVEGLYVVVMEAVREAAGNGLPTNFIDSQGKKYLEKLKLKTLTGEFATPHEPYTFIHNTGCSECQEGYGAVTPYTENPLGDQVALMIDIALLGSGAHGERLFPVLYAVIEDSFWKKRKEVGVYNRMPLNVQHLVGNTEPLSGNINPFHKEFQATT